MSRRAAAAVLVSIAGHACLLAGLGGARVEDRAEAPFIEQALPHLAPFVDRVALSLRLRAERQALVEGARADWQAGRLELGRFLLRGNRIDAEELGLDFDEPEALARFNAKVAALREGLREGDVTHAIPGVFGELRYHGQPGGLMGGALLDGGGSCEQIAQLVAATVFDAGRPEAAFLRFYGAPMTDGVAHLAPIALEGGVERDLMTGRAAMLEGARIAAADLVEVYARAHGLAPPLASAANPSGASGPSEGGSNAGSASLKSQAARVGPDRPTLFVGFPPNNDRYPGSLPLYAARAIKDVATAAEEPDDPEASRERARNCAYFLRMAVLSPPLVEVEPSFAGLGGAVEPRRVPDPSRLEREAGLLREAEDLVLAPGSDDADRLMGWACLSALGEVSAVDFTLAGERSSADAALAKRKEAREEGEKALTALLGRSDATQRVVNRLSEEMGGRTWLLLALPGGDELVFRALAVGRREDWGRVSALAALVLWPATQARALAVIERLPVRDQVDVMHEVFHAHDHARPWATNVELIEAPSSDGDNSDNGDIDRARAHPPDELRSHGGAGAMFRRVYRVFRGLAWRLWEGQRDVGEIVAALRADAAREGIDAAWEAALLEYCSRNALGLYSQRDVGMAIAMTVRDAVRKNGHPSLATLSRQLDYIEAQGRLDARTLADALRMP